MATSPSILNYFVGKGVVKWKGSLDSVYRHLGNTPLAEITPQITRLPHYSAMRGIRSLDFNPVVSKMAALKLHLEEWTAENMALAMMGSMDALVSGSPDRIHGMNLDEVTGSIRIIGTNEIGEKKQVDIAYVNIAPSAAWSFIGENYGILEITGEVTSDPVTGDFFTVEAPITGEVT